MSHDLLIHRCYSSRFPQWNEHSSRDRSRSLGAEGQRSTERLSEAQGDFANESHSYHHSHGSGETPEGKSEREREVGVTGDERWSLSRRDC